MNAESKLVVVEPSNRKTQEIIAAETAAEAAMSPVQAALQALRQGVTTEQLGGILALQERWEANQARKAFVAAMAEFKRDPPAIVKDKHVKFQTSKGVTEYDHATLFAVCAAAIDGLARVDITHRWHTEQRDGMIHVTCTLTHILGHTESMTLFGPPDDTGGKNTIQQISSTVSYLQRYTLLGVTGLATKDQDDDGRAAGKQAATEPPPDGYENWKADMTAVADEGIERLEKCWSDATAAFRRYVVKFDEDWWLNLKGRAKKATEARQ